MMRRIGYLVLGLIKELFQCPSCHSMTVCSVCACRKLLCRNHVDVLAVCRLYRACSQLPSSCTGHAWDATLGSYRNAPLNTDLRNLCLNAVFCNHWNLRVCLSFCKHFVPNWLSVNTGNPTLYTFRLTMIFKNVSTVLIWVIF